VIIFLILILALILRLINLNQSLWLDEAVQAITAKNSISYIFTEITGDFHPPIYHFLMHFWVMIFNNSEISLRFPSVLFGIGAVYFVYKIGRLSNLKYLGYLGALFLATAPFHIYYSQEARMYSMGAFLVAGSVYYYMEFLKDAKGSFKNKGVLYFIFTLLALYTDYYAFLVLLAQGIYSFFKKRYRFFYFYLLYFIFYLPWLPMVLNQIKAGIAAKQIIPLWGSLVNISFIKALPLTFVKFSIGRITIFDKKIYSVVILGILGWLGILGMKVVKEIKNKKEDLLNIIALWFGVPLVFSWIISLVIPNFQPFRLLLILPAFYLLLAFGANENRSFPKYLFIALILGINLTSLSVYYLNPYFYREDWRGLVNFLKKDQQIKVVLPSTSSNWPIKYYDSASEIKMIYGVAGIEKISYLSSFSNLGNKVFYIRYLVPLFDPNETILKKLEESGYTKTEEVSFNQIPLWKFTKK